MSTSSPGIPAKHAAAESVIPKAPEAPNSSVLDSVLSGGGEMGALMRAFDWSQTPLGPVASWSPALRMMARLLLANRFPLLLWWGPQFCQLYNDAYRPILGKKHPQFIGRPVSECWSEIWHILEPLIQTPFSGGPSTWIEDFPLEVNRHGFVEETHFTVAYSPVPDETVPGRIGGVLATVHEISEKVVSERRTKALRDLGAGILEERSAEEACARAAGVLAQYPKDVAFALLYLLDPERKIARLAETAGVDQESQNIAPATIELSLSRAPWPLSRVIETGQMELVENLGQRFATIPRGPWSDPPDRAAVVPVRSSVAHQLAGFLIAGISPRLRFDELYRSFLELTASQIATAVTNARAYEEERKRAEALAELDRAKTLFFSNVSHEFRTPLTLMLGPLDEVLEKASPRLNSDEQQQLEATRRNALRLLKLVNSLLDFSRIEAGRVHAVFEPIDVATLTGEIASVFRSAMEKAGLRFSVECEPTHEPVYVDRDMWEKIVLNLLSNAFKFTFQGEVVLTLRALNGWVELAVRDTGVGIPPEEQGRVFERFHRIESTRARTYEGTGIGLALVQELVKLHGGTIRVQSALNTGSTFTVTIPQGTSHLPANRIGVPQTVGSTAVSSDAYVDEALRWLPNASGAAIQKESAAEPDAASGSRDVVPGNRRELILVADDNADMRDYLVHLLRNEYTVHAVADGNQAVDAARALRPALVLTDVMMPGLDGIGVVNAIRSDESLKSTPIILLSARAGEEARIEGLQTGADDYLVKPFTARELAARVSTHVKMANLRREATERESKLREQAELERRRLQELLAQAPAAIGLLKGADHRWTYVNDDYVRLTGRDTPADFLGKTVAESLPEIGAQGFLALLADVYRTGKPYFGREMKAILNRSAKGLPDESYWDFVYQPVRDTQGEVEGILVHAVEVTDRVIARTALERSEKEYRDFAETASIALHWVGPSGTILWANKAELDMLGYSAEEYIGHNIAEFHVDEPVIGDILTRLCKGERLRDYEARLRAKDGSFRDVVIDSSVLFENGKFIHTRCFTRDITERKKVNQRIQESEARLRAIVETTPECVKLIAPDGILLHMNSAGLSMIEADRAEAVEGRSVYDLIAAEDRDRFREFNERICGGERGSLEFDIIGLKGVRRHMETQAAPLKNADGTVLHLAIARDVTERKRMEEERVRAERVLHENEQRLRLAHQAAAIGAFEWDLQTNSNRWTPELEAMYGRAPGSFDGTQQAWEQLIHPEDRAQALEAVEVGFRTGEPVQCEWRVTWPDGSTHWLFGRWQVFKDSEGKPVRMAGVNIDVTSRKEAEAAQQRLATIVKCSDDAIVSKDLNGTVTSWNPAAERLFGYSAEEMIGRSITTIIPPELRRGERNILAAIGRGDTIDHFETVRLTKSGERIQVSVTVSPVRDEAGNVVGAAKIARDITHQKQAEEALRTTERLAAVGRLAATVAHEINNPLAAVTNLIYLGKQNAVREDVREFLTSAEEELDRISHLTKQTLGFYRESKGATATTLGAIVESTISIFASRTRNRGITVGLEIRQDPEVYAVPSELRQLLGNLLSNSIDAVESGGRIRIRVSATTKDGLFTRGVRLTVADSGPGVPDEVRPKIFEPFFTTKKDVGTGLGLWICKSIVDRYCGSIRIRSRTEKGKSGTVISVVLPLSNQEQAMTDTLRQTV